jgi:hypothetical protein
MDEVSSQGTSVPLRQDDVQRLFHLILLNPSCGGQIALTSERSESLARRMHSSSKHEISIMKDEPELDTTPPR